MNISYSTKKLEKILSEQRQIKKQYPKDYMRISARLSELEAADNLAEIPNTPPPRRHKLLGNRAGSWGIDYSKNCRIIITPIHEYTVNGLTTITDIKIDGLEDYH